MDTNRNLHRFSVFVAVSTLVLIFAGGLVTSTGSGLSVPDWPLSFGRLFPEMTGGVAYEHGHRMVAALVGIFTIILAVWLWMRESRKWVRLLGLLAVVAVAAQAVLGGATVLLRLPLALSVGHAALAQVFLCIVIAIALSTSRGWQSGTDKIEDSSFPSVRTLGVITAVLVFLQTMLGALTRHTGGGLAIPDYPLSYGRIIPPYFSTQVLYHFAHRVGGLLVLLFAVWLLIKVFRISRSNGSLRFPAAFLLVSLLLQIVLGGVTIWSRKEPILTSLHVVCGALVLAVCVWLTMNAFRTLRPHSARQQIEATAI